MSRGESKPPRDDQHRQGEMQRQRQNQLERLFQLHAADLRRLAVGILRDPALADDVVQVTFAKLAEHEPLSSDAYRAWLFKVAYHEALTLIRRQKAQQTALGEMAGWLVERDGSGDGLVDSSTASPGSHLEKRERLERVRDAVASLPEAEREVVQLRIYQQLKFREIAATLEIPLGTALSRMRAALQRLARQLADDEE